MVANKLMQMERTDVVNGYNGWYAQYRKEREEVMRSAAKLIRENIGTITNGNKFIKTIYLIEEYQ